MNRHYTAEEYKELCIKLRNSFKSATITTDVMVGFNNESDDDFNKSLDFVKEIAFEKVHVFPYSERKGTAASKKGDSVPKEEKERRASIMINETDVIRESYCRKLIGMKDIVLFENEISENIYQGYTKSYIPIRVKSEKDLIGKEIEVKITEFDSDSDVCFGLL